MKKAGQGLKKAGRMVTLAIGHFKKSSKITFLFGQKYFDFVL